MRFYRDETGRVRREGGSSNEGWDSLTSFLEWEYGFLPTSRAILAEFERGRTAAWEMGGNAFALTLDHRHARIEFMLDDDVPTLILSHEELRESLDAWETFVGAERELRGQR